MRQVINRKKNNSHNFSTGILVFEDGTSFSGSGIGYEGVAVGEICFNTGMTGYQEIYTDPSYYGQIMVTTNAHIGNYGVKDDEKNIGVEIANSMKQSDQIWLKKASKWVEDKVVKPLESKEDTKTSEKSLDELKPWEKYQTLFCLPYRMIYAVATQNTIMLYDTQQAEPFARISRIHYISLNDLAW